MPQQILTDPHFEVVRLDDAPVIVMRRTSTPIKDIASFEVVAAALERLIPTGQRRGLGVLTDLRAAPLRNDPAFEKQMTPLIARLWQGFICEAVLLSTAVGVLQLRRMIQSSGRVADVFTEEPAAIAYIRQMVQTSRSEPPRRPGGSKPPAP